MRSLVIVTPVYEDLEAAEKLFSELHKAFPKDLVIVAVDDGSIDSPLDPNIFSRLGIRGELIRLKRNLGHQRAIAVGLN
jgi:glycosyltransferase involved in cell wall biosynthesis